LIDRLLEGSGAVPGADRGSASDLQVDGVRELLDGRATPDDVAAVARWYETFGTLDEQPMPRGDDPHERIGVARALLKADGTLNGPHLDMGETDLLVGERVISTRDVPGFGLAAGTPGTVQHIDAERGN